MKTFHHYDIAYRKMGEKEYTLVQPPNYGWIADPFLVKYRGQIYLFAEIFLYLSERNGVIGYCKYDENRFGEWMISMDRHWHLSYPNVFEKDDKIYMIPESYQLGEVVLYELQEFPDKWKKIRSYISDVEYVDSTILEYRDGKQYMFTFERDSKTPHGKGLLYEVGENGLKNKRILSDSLEGTRCGGKIITDNGKYYRVGQDCTQEYGGGIIFYEIDMVTPKYSEHEVCRLYPEDISGDFDINYTRLHTYNRLDGIEVIDLGYPSCTEEENEASRRIHKVFVDKYEV